MLTIIIRFGYTVWSKNLLRLIKRKLKFQEWVIDWFSEWVKRWMNEWVSAEGSEWVSEWVNHSFWNSSFILHHLSIFLYHLSFILYQFVILPLSFVILPSSFTWRITSFYFIESFIRFIGTVHRTGHDWRSAAVVRSRNVNTVLLNGNIVTFKSLLNFIFWMAFPFFIFIWWRLFNYLYCLLLLINR